MAEVQKKDKTKEVNSKKRNLDNVTEQSNNDNKSMQEPKSKKQRREVSNNDTDENKNECENGNEQEEEEFTKQDFMKEANNIDIECFNKKIALKPRCNDTGSVGWHGSKRTAINIEKKKNWIVYLIFISLFANPQNGEKGKLIVVKMTNLNAILKMMKMKTTTKTKLINVIFGIKKIF